IPGAPTGLVTFLDGGRPIGSGRLSTPSPLFARAFMTPIRYSSFVVGPDRSFWFIGGSNILRILASGTATQDSIPNSSCYSTDIAAGPDGSFWFTELEGNKIGRITPSGTIVEFSIPTPESRPAFITTGPDGNLWFTESATSKIGRIATSGAIT